MKVWRYFFVLLLVSSVVAKDVKVFEFRNFRRRDLIEQGLTLNKDIRLKVEAWGASDKWGDEMLAYGWILDSETRRVVWELTTSNSSEERRRYNRSAKEEIKLRAGRYEIYYAVSPRGTWDTSYKDFGDFLEDLFDGFRGSKWRREARSWGIVLWADESDQDAVKLTDISRDEEVVVQLAPLGDDEFEKEGFSLRRESRIRIYAIGEGEDGEMSDYGWIIDGATRETIWEMDYRDTRRAGGGEKNRMIDEEIVLPRGDYVVHFVTDGSHSSDDWNRLPPYDLHHWGITLWGVSGELKSDQVVKSYEPEEDRRVIVDMTRVGNDRFEKEGFTLKETTKIRIRCLGEFGSDQHFADGGWILDANTRELVWEMTHRNSKRAGGASKNRMFDGIITLEPGEYEVNYITDDSHAYRRWNSGPPFDPEAWGITLWGIGDDFDSGSIVPYREEDDPNILVQLTRLGDHERARRRFELDKTARVRIYAIGEGDDDEMYDYGWIEDDRGRRVWKMEYWDTEHAGGASKNRMINEVVRLRAGGYTVRYRSDGSHSFEDWNDTPPRDPDHWGITVRIEK